MHAIAFEYRSEICVYEVPGERPGNRVKRKNPGALILKSPRSGRLEGYAKGETARSWGCPSFETRPADAPQDEEGGISVSPDRPGRTPLWV